MVKAGNIFLNILWFVFVLLAFAGGVFMIFQTIDQYMRFDVITITKIKRQSQIKLPALTFCTKFNTSRMLINCKYADNPNACQINDLTLIRIQSTRQLNCIQINHGTSNSEIFDANGEGWMNSLKIVFYNQLVENSFQFAVTDNSARVEIDDVRELIYSGYETYVVLRKTYQRALGPPYSDCNQTDDYRDVNCIDDCLNEKMSEFCRCEFPLACRNGTDWQMCLKAYYTNSTKLKLDCKQQCPIECEKVIYSISRRDILLEDPSQYPFENYKSRISKKFNITGMSDLQIEKKLTILYIYYERLEITEFTQSPSMTSANLIGNVGGILGKSQFFLYGIKYFDKICF